MACNTSKSSCSVGSDRLKVTQGASKSFNIQLTDKNTCEPMSLSGFTGATAYFPQQDSDDPVSVTGSLLSADLGKISFSLSTTTTALMNEGEDQDFEVKVLTTAETIIQKIEQKLTVVARQFS